MNKMSIFKNHWIRGGALLVLGLIVGVYIGADLALRYANTKAVEYPGVLEDYYINSRLLNITMSLGTITEAEKENLKVLRAGHERMLRGAFLELVQLHKSGRYQKKEVDIREHLTRAKSFMEDRPDAFINKKFTAPSSIADKINNPMMKEDPASIRVTNQFRKQLQNAFNYVDMITEKKPKNDIEPPAAN